MARRLPRLAGELEGKTLMTNDRSGNEERDDGQKGQLTFFKALIFVAVLFAAGGLMFLAGRMSGHSAPANTSMAK